MSNLNKRKLILTVGTGNKDKREETLLDPLRKSIATEEWDGVVFLASVETRKYAEILKKELDSEKIEISMLSEGDEYNPDKAYAHFDEVLESILKSVQPERIVVDFTRGTRTMSAALVLAAARRTIPNLRYLDGPRDQSGMVMSGEEKVRNIRTTTVDGHRRLDLAKELFRRCNFAAVADILPDTDQAAIAEYKKDLKEAFGSIRMTARFYGAWDRLDYKSASEVQVGTAPYDDWKGMWPSEKVRTWVRSLTEKPDCAQHAAMADWLRRLVVDLLANGKRRIEYGQHEDALVRGYRVLELVGQIRLFDHSLDSSNLDRDHPAVKKLEQKLEENRNSIPLGTGSKGKLTAGQHHVARLLKIMKDPLAEDLLDFGNSYSNISNRNKSILIHGFTTKAPEDRKEFHDRFRKLEELVRKDSGTDVDGRLRIAQSMEFRD